MNEKVRKAKAEEIMNLIDKIPRNNIAITNGGYRYKFFYGREYPPEEVMSRPERLTWITNEHWAVTKEPAPTKFIIHVNQLTGKETKLWQQEEVIERTVFYNRAEVIAFIYSLLDENVRIDTYRSS